MHKLEGCQIYNVMPAWFDATSPSLHSWLRCTRTFFLAARPECPPKLIKSEGWECRALRGVSKGAACKKHSSQPARRSHVGRRLGAGKFGYITYAEWYNTKHCLLNPQINNLACKYLPNVVFSINISLKPSKMFHLRPLHLGKIAGNINIK
jgi:hypothetical protein